MVSPGEVDGPEVDRPEVDRLSTLEGPPGRHLAFRAGPAGAVGRVRSRIAPECFTKMAEDRYSR
jgi:hypothetical protein